MTAREHLVFLSKLKRNGSNLTQKDIDARLKDVRLLKLANNRVQTYSGGMKRRLSVAISTIGSPKIIFMDEVSFDLLKKKKKYSNFLISSPPLAWTPAIVVTFGICFKALQKID